MATPIVPTTNAAVTEATTVPAPVTPSSSPVEATTTRADPTTSTRPAPVVVSTAESSAAAPPTTTTTAAVSSAAASSIVQPSSSSAASSSSLTPTTSTSSLVPSSSAPSSSSTSTVVTSSSAAVTSSAVPTTTSVAAVTTQQPSTQVLTITRSAVSQPGLITSFSDVSPASSTAHSAEEAAAKSNKGGIGGSGLPVGGLVGIIIGALAILAIIGLLVTRSMRKRARAKRTAHRSSLFEPWPAPGPVSMEDEPYEKPAYDAPAQSYPVGHANADVYDEQAYGAGYPAGQYDYNEYPPQHYANYPGQPYTDMAAAGAGAAGVGAAGAAGLGAAGASAGETAAAASGIVDGSMVRVKVAFVRSLEDELAITPGQQLYLHQAYDDGWTLCEDQAQNRGVVPLSCLEPWDESTSQGWTPPAEDQTLSAEVTGQRRSSLYAPQP